MKKSIFYLLGFIIVLVIDYFLKDLYDIAQVEQFNHMHALSVLDKALNPFGLFLLFKFFAPTRITFKAFAIMYAIIMALEFSVGYFYGSGHFDYNYLIGCFIGLLVVYGLELLIPKVEEEKQQEKAT
jgi:hypothetical protein